MSGFIPEVEGFDLDLSRPGLPIAITHGALDPVIGVDFARLARQRLEAAGNRLLYRESPIGHGIDPAVIPELRAWLAAAAELAG
jgi:predicted esterase